MTDVAVVGSLNVDVVVPVPDLPRRGQTILGGTRSRGGGGKGGNQAVAARRLGRSVAMVAAVGDDAEGTWLVDQLMAEGVDSACVLRAPGHPTGQAIVFVTPDGDSTIVVDAGANDWLAAAQVEAAAAADLLSRAGCLLVQHEVGAEVVAAAVRQATGQVVLNPAPARPVDPAVLAGVDVLVPNRGELAVMVGAQPTSDAGQLAGMARSLCVRGQVVVTLGADGALVVDGTRSIAVPAEDVVAVDATAAGDAFCAGLADALLDGASVPEAAAWASRVAAVTVTRPGAMASLPRRHEIPGARGPGVEAGRWPGS